MYVDEVCVFLLNSRGWGWCLDDPPGRNELAAQSVLPGVLYSATHQCRLQYGSSSQLCDDMDVRRRFSLHFSHPHGLGEPCAQLLDT